VGKRLFVAIDLPESTRQLLAALDPHVRGVHWTDPAQMHLTLSFLVKSRMKPILPYEKNSA
jgi:2''-5'' RNA ligase